MKFLKTKPPSTKKMAKQALANREATASTDRQAGADSQNGPRRKSSRLFHRVNTSAQLSGTLLDAILQLNSVLHLR